MEIPAVTDAVFSRQVYERRRELNISLREIAQRSGVSAATISRIENGRRSPTLDIAVKLAAALGLEAPSHSGFEETRRRAPPLDEVQELLSNEIPQMLISYRRLGTTILRGGVRRDVSRIAARNGYKMAVLLRGAFQLRTNDGFKDLLKPGATINCRLLSSRTYFAVAAEEAELLWIG
jgi:transcriptional regulator with XRE-family HTH domain